MVPVVSAGAAAARGCAAALTPDAMAGVTRVRVIAAGAAAAAATRHWTQQGRPAEVTAAPADFASSPDSSGIRDPPPEGAVITVITVITVIAGVIGLDGLAGATAELGAPERHAKISVDPSLVAG